MSRKRVRRTLALCLALGCSRICAAQPSSEQLARLLTGLMREGEVPGLSIVVVRESRVQWQRSLGVANAETGVPLSDGSVFEAASLGKPVFAYGVLKLVDAGLLDLDAPLAAYLPETVSDERKRKVTARMVLSHTTGFQNEVMPGETLRLHFEPGERFSYSGAGFSYLQRVVEHLTGKRLPELIDELVFQPLGMTSASFVWLPEMERTKVFGHSAAGRVAPRRRPSEPALSMLHVTAQDYARFMIAVMKGTGLKPATARAMLTTQAPIDESCTSCLVGGSGPISQSLSWGLGWGLESSTRGQAFWHWGENNGEFQHFAIGYPAGEGLIVFTNSGNGFSIMPEVAAAAMGGKHPAFAWMRYDGYKSPARALWRDILARGADRALRSASAAELSESQLNRIGYGLLERRKITDAIAVFRRNTVRFPESFNAHDSLAEAYAAAGARAQAVVHYKRSLELNPENANAAAALAKLAVP